MIMGWAGTNYDIWYQPGCVGFNTGGGDIYGMSTTSGVLNEYHTFTFVMSTTQDNTSKQKIFMDGVNRHFLCAKEVSYRVLRVLEAHLQHTQLDVMGQINFFWNI
jgi:hypothetical protein